MTNYTEEEIAEKSAELVIEIIQVLEDHYPDQYREIIMRIQARTY